MELSPEQRLDLEHRFDGVEDRLEELADEVKQAQKQLKALGYDVSQLIQSVREVRLLLGNLGGLMPMPVADPERRDRDTLPDPEPR